MADFAFNKGEEHFDIYSGEGGKDSRLLHRKVPLERAEKIVGGNVGGYGDVKRNDFGTHVVVPHGARKPGKYRQDRHG